MFSSYDSFFISKNRMLYNMMDKIMVIFSIYYLKSMTYSNFHKKCG